MQFRVVIGFLLVFISYLQAAQVIIIMGPSCAGKSTLGKFTCAQLNSQYEEWRVVDFDDVEENIEHLIVAVNEC
ncbi:MAG TPA: hypothetical protein VHX42_01765, partial [Candidatus Babeliales bacterium]|nr:hypothetical protein [Candidatus Babeliales bacterium]